MHKLRALALFLLLTLSVALSGCQKTEIPEETLSIKQGLIVESGNTYFYNDDGSQFSGGYKEIPTGSGVDYYYFLPNAKAFSTGLKEVTLGETTNLYYFGHDGKALTCAWETVGDIRYYFGENGRAAKNTFLTIDGNRYYFNDQCTPATGGCFFLEAEQSWYYADEAGILAADTVIEGYKLDADGKCPTKYRIRELVSQHTDDTMTEQEKIEALYNWVLNSDMTYIRSYEHVRADWVWADSWVDDMAASLMDNRGGNCFHYGAFMGMLIREATGLPVAVAIGDTIALSGGWTPHCWAVVCQEEIWYVYDVELQKFTDTPDYNCYKILAEDSFLHVNPTLTPLYSE